MVRHQEELWRIEECSVSDREDTTNHNRQVVSCYVQARLSSNDSMDICVARLHKCSSTGNLPALDAIPRAMSLPQKAVQLAQNQQRMFACSVASWVRLRVPEFIPELPYTVFAGAATVSMELFVESLVEMNHALTNDNSPVVMMMIYMQRVISGGALPVSFQNVFRLLLAGQLCAVKYHADELLFNSEYARLIGLTLADVNGLELGFLNLLRFELYASGEEFAVMNEELARHSRSFVAELL